MFIRGFLRAQGWKHKGSIPLLEGSMEELETRLVEFSEYFGFFWGILNGFSPSGLRGAFQKRGYVAMEELLKGYLAIRDKLLQEAVLELERLLLGMHDAYVRERNQQSPQLKPFSKEHPRRDGELECSQCGECCKGPASGPLSTSPVDLALWKNLGREDLLYHTSQGVGKASEKSHQQWAACPFLRFSKLGEGVCLVHPVKPLLCREFFCQEPSASSKG